jgi:hypothetical protein
MTRPETDPRRLLDASLERWAELRPGDADANIEAQLRHTETFALAAIADELHEVRYLLWRATRAPGETSPADVDAWRARVKGAGNAD